VGTEPARRSPVAGVPNPKDLDVELATPRRTHTELDRESRWVGGGEAPNSACIPSMRRRLQTRVGVHLGG
jgi:hypothetical protein